MPAPVSTDDISTPGRALFEDAVPKEHRAHLVPGAPVEANAVKSILQHVADTNPTQYRRISSDLLKLGNKGAVETDSSFGLEDLRPPIDTEAVRRQLQQDEDRVHARKDLNPKQKKDELIKLYGKLSGEMPGKIYGAALSRGSNLAKMVASGARGNKNQLNSNLGMDGLVVDSQGNPVPIPINRSYAEGLSPSQYFAASYGTRSGLVTLKQAVPDAGFLSKQISAANQDLIISGHDCETTRGLPVDAQDRDNVGALLARPTAGHAQDTAITSKMLKDFETHGLKRILVRSPITCGQTQGICAKCAGIRERGTLPPMNDNVGLAASSALGEPLSQGLISSKHGSGVANAGKATRATGFKAVNQLVQVPKIFEGGATAAQHDGHVSKIEDAAQGGKYVYVDDGKSEED